MKLKEIRKTYEGLAGPGPLYYRDDFVSEYMDALLKIAEIAKEAMFGEVDLDDPHDAQKRLGEAIEELEKI